MKKNEKKKKEWTLPIIQNYYSEIEGKNIEKERIEKERIEKEKNELREQLKKITN